MFAFYGIGSFTGGFALGLIVLSNFYDPNSVDEVFTLITLHSSKKQTKMKIIHRFS